jgi:hypothetical protein
MVSKFLFKKLTNWIYEKGTEKRMVELRLPPTPTGDLPDPGDPSHERVSNEELTIHPLPTTPATPTLPANRLPPRTIATDVIPPDTRRKLRDLVLKSSDPRKALEAFRSRMPRNLLGATDSTTPVSPGTALRPSSASPTVTAADPGEVIPKISKISNLALIPGAIMSESPPSDLAQLASSPTLVKFESMNAVSDQRVVTRYSIPDSPHQINPSRYCANLCEPRITPPFRFTRTKITRLFDAYNHRLKP